MRMKTLSISVGAFACAGALLAVGVMMAAGSAAAHPAGPRVGAVVGALAAGAGVAPRGAVATKETLTLEGARQVISAAESEAMKRKGTGAIAVVDNAGNLLAMERLDGTFAASWDISIGKARTSAMFGKATREFEEIIRNGRTPMLALEGFTPLQGGVPIVVGGKVVGAVGVSGAASAQEDEDIAIAGAAAIGGG